MRVYYVLLIRTGLASVHGKLLSRHGTCKGACQATSGFESNTCACPQRCGVPLKTCCSWEATQLPAQPLSSMVTSFSLSFARSGSMCWFQQCQEGRRGRRRENDKIKETSHQQPWKPQLSMATFCNGADIESTTAV